GTAERIFAARGGRGFPASSFGRNRRHAGGAGAIAEPDSGEDGPNDPDVDRRAQSVLRNFGIDGGRRGGGERGRASGICESGVRIDSWAGSAASCGERTAGSGAADGVD